VPFVNYGLIALNLLFFLFELSLGERLERFVYAAAVIPALFTGSDHVLTLPQVLRTSLDPSLGGRVLVAMFLHGGWAHVLGNMLYLWIFGDNVEDRVGHFRYLVFYLVCGWTASYAHIWSQPASRMPSLGASGAIAGVLGAYITLYPRANVLTAIIIFFFVRVVSIPAIFFLGIWFLQQFLYGTMALHVSTVQNSGGVAWWAHIGGFAAGFVLIWIFQSRKRRPPLQTRDWWERR
jgi:membrane associated rhomboid family serine protease